MNAQTEIVQTRFRVAVDLHRTGVTIMRQNLRRRFREDSESEITERLSAWLRQRPGAEQGDGVGRPRTA